jgi:quinol monooxygenase YgiN
MSHGLQRTPESGKPEEIRTTPYPMLKGIEQDSDQPSKNSPNFLSEVQFTHSCAESLRITIGQIYSTQEGNSMEALGLLVTLEARPGKEADAEAFLKSAQPLAVDETGTLKWYAIKLGPGRFGIFDTFANEGGRNAHLCGEIAKALGARAVELLAAPPQIEKVEVLASTPLKG